MTTRRRGTALEDAILQAGWDQLLEHGYAGFTFEGIAARAQTAKAVLYRRWPDRHTLLQAVLIHHGVGAPVDVSDTGSLRDDVLALLTILNTNWESSATLLSVLIGTYFEATGGTLSELREALIGDRDTAMTEILHRALVRGELAAMPPARVVSIPYALLRQEVLMNLSRVPDKVLLEIVDDVFIPLVAPCRPSTTDSSYGGFQPGTEQL